MNVFNMKRAADGGADRSCLHRRRLAAPGQGSGTTSSSSSRSEIKKGDDAIVAVRLVDKRSGKPVPDAVIIAKRVDMAPDGMAEMSEPIEQLPSTEPGVYRFKAALVMAGGWRLSLGAKVQGETGTAREQARVQGRPMSRAGRTGLTLAAILAAGAGGYWAGHRDLALPPITWLRAVPWLQDAASVRRRMPDRLHRDR